MIDTSTVNLLRVVPTDRGHLVLEFAEHGFRVFDALVAYRTLGWEEFAYSHRVKQLAYDAHAVTWPNGRRLDAAYLLAHSAPIDAATLARQTLRLGFKNQAPTAMHASHHEYDVHLFPFGQRPFSVGESIGGGHAEMGIAVIRPRAIACVARLEDPLRIGRMRICDTGHRNRKQRAGGSRSLDCARLPWCAGRVTPACGRCRHSEFEQSA